jgi:hypothetical protein
MNHEHLSAGMSENRLGRRKQVRAAKTDVYQRNVSVVTPAPAKI